METLRITFLTFTSSDQVSVLMCDLTSTSPMNLSSCSWCIISLFRAISNWLVHFFKALYSVEDFRYSSLRINLHLKLMRVIMRRDEGRRLVLLQFTYTHYAFTLVLYGGSFLERAWYICTGQIAGQDYSLANGCSGGQGESIYQGRVLVTLLKSNFGA